MKDCEKKLANANTPMDRLERWLEKWTEENEKRYQKWDEYINRVKEELGGISKSNGMVAEEYFYNSLSASMTFGKVHFDEIIMNLGKKKKILANGKAITGEYDIVMINKTSICLVEVKYRVRLGDATELANEKVEVFKLLHPDYADNKKIYLAIGGMSFEKKCEDEAKKLGIGILKLNGDAVEIDDTELKTY